MAYISETYGTPRIGMTTRPKALGGADYSRLLTPDEAKEDCYARTCPKCKTLYHALQHFDWCPICEEEPLHCFTSGSNNARP